jgi:hypothetical protein
MTMDVAQTGLLLARIQVHDNRQIGAVTIEEWHHDLQGLAYVDALDAVREHRRTSTEYLTANHVIAGVRRIRDRRLDGIDVYRCAFPGDPDDWRAELAWWNTCRGRVADGEDPDVVFDMPVLVTREMPVLEGTFRRPGARS